MLILRKRDVVYTAMNTTDFIKGKSRHQLNEKWFLKKDSCARNGIIDSAIEIGNI